MSLYDLLHRAQQTENLSQTQKGVLLALVTFADGDGWAWPSVGTLATYASVRERAVQSALSELVAAGVVVRQDRVGATCRFQVRFDALAKRGGVGKAPPQEKHPRTTDTPAPAAPPQDDHRGGAFPAPGGVIVVHPRGAFPAPEEAIEEATRKEPLKEPLRDMSPAPAAPLFAQPPAAAPEPVPPPKREPKPAPADEAEALAVWMAWKETHRGCKATPPPDVAKGIRAALKAHGAETVIAVVRWSQTSDHSRARFLQGERNGRMVPGEAYGLATIMRHVGEYDGLRVAQEEAPAASPRMSALPPGMKPRGVVIDADSGKVEVEEGPRQPAAQGGKRDNLSLATMFYSEIVNAETEEESENEA